MTREKRVKMARKMDYIVRGLFNDERWIMDWLSLGVPDGATDEDYEYYGDDEAAFWELVELFIVLTEEELNE